jgi:hypothetical protein
VLRDAVELGGDCIVARADLHGVQRVVSDPMEAAYIGIKLWAAAVNKILFQVPRRLFVCCESFWRVRGSME